jgi:hypothetical protein
MVELHSNYISTIFHTLNAVENNQNNQLRKSGWPLTLIRKVKYFIYLINVNILSEY